MESKLKPDWLPYPELSRSWYARNNNRSPYPLLSKSWYRNNGLRENPLLKNAYPLLSRDWYKRRGELIAKNISRNNPSTHSEITDIDTILKKLQKDIETELFESKSKELEAISQSMEYFAENGPIVLAKEMIRSYQNYKDFSDSYLAPSTFMTRISKYGSFKSITVFKRCFFILTSRPDAVQKVESILNQIPESELLSQVNNSIKSKVGDIFPKAMKLASTKKDKDLIKGLFANATSGKLTASLMGVKNKSACVAQKAVLRQDVDVFNKIESESHDEVEVYLQRSGKSFTKQQKEKMKKKTIEQKWRNYKSKAFEGRGRKLKIAEFPELSMVLEQIFQAGDRGIGGGLESHPRLTCETRFRSKDNALNMPTARKILLEAAPPGFRISLSTCYNYTNSYRENSRQAVQHHHGRGINANISLKRPSRTVVSKLVVNLHWSTKNVNLFLEEAENDPTNHMIDSRDAKTIIPGDIQPVALSCKSYRKISVEDHTYDQSRENAIYPMTHLFVDVKKYLDVEGQSSIERTVVRSGVPITYVYLAFFERETTFNALNEFFNLCTVPQIDTQLRQGRSLKENLSFIVDNGHGEDPDSPLTKMCLVRILISLKIQRITQRSFAEYNSKRNFVERVHASENMVLAQHGPFASKQVHANARIGSPEHEENMEKMAENVVECLKTATFSENQLIAIRGPKTKVFNDEERLQEFLKLSEEKKASCGWTYSPVKGTLMNELKQLWGFNDKKRKYFDDYVLANSMNVEKSSWLDKYSTTIYHPDFTGRRYEIQPIPDYVRWYETSGELHYMSTEETISTTTEIEELRSFPGIFLPDKLIQYLHTVSSQIPDEVLRNFTALCWIPFSDVKKRFEELNEKMANDLQNSQDRAVWAQHQLFSMTVPELKQKCSTLNINTKNLLKHEIVESLANATKQKKPKPLKQLKFEKIPETIKGISELPIHVLKKLLNEKNVNTLANKDELVMRLYLLKSGRSQFVSHHVKKILLNTILIAEKLILEQLKLKTLGTKPIQRRRKFATPGINKSIIPVFPSMKRVEDLIEVFGELKVFLRVQVAENAISTAKIPRQVSAESANNVDERERYFEIGATLKIKWVQNQLGVGWKPGWYVARVHSSDYDNDCIDVIYDSQPNVLYTVDVTSHISTGKIKLLKK